MNLEIMIKKDFFKGVSKAVNFINTEINETIQGFDVTKQTKSDRTLIELDGTSNKSRLGANSILAVSLACAKAAKFLKIPLLIILEEFHYPLPTPLMNIVNGGCHSNNKLDFQEFMIVPMGFKSFKESLRAGCEVFYSLKDLLNKHSFSVSVGDEGGFAPDFKSNKECLDFIINSIEKADTNLGKIFLLRLMLLHPSFLTEKNIKF